MLLVAWWLQDMLTKALCCCTAASWDLVVQLQLQAEHAHLCVEQADKVPARTIEMCGMPLVAKAAAR